jgi:hypothetical protein
MLNRPPRRFFYPERTMVLAPGDLRAPRSGKTETWHSGLLEPEPYAVPAATDDPRCLTVVLRKSSMSPVTSSGSSEMGT